METETTPLPLETVDQVLSSYGVKLIFPIKVGQLGVVPRAEALLLVKFKPVDNETQDRVKQSVANSLLIYPRDFFKRNDVKCFYFGHSRFNESYYHNLTGGIVFDVKIFLGNDFGFIGDLSNTTFHHELFHRLQSRTLKGIKFSLEWEKRFPRLTKLKAIYFRLCSRAISENHQTYYGNKFEKVTEEELETKYFNEYGVESPGEDKATTSEFLLSRPDIIKILNDLPPIKKEKLSHMMTFYGLVSGGKMNVGFWSDYAEGKVDANYWRTRS